MTGRTPLAKAYSLRRRKLQCEPAARLFFRLGGGFFLGLGGQRLGGGEMVVGLAARNVAHFGLVCHRMVFR